MAFLAVATVTCGGSNPPTSPGGNNPPSGGGNTAPAREAPADDEQLTTLRPTLRVRNGTSAQAGARSYEFQISDRSDFVSGGGSTSAYFVRSFTRTGVAEGSTATSIDVDQELQPATRFYWRARWTQGSTSGDWSATSTFRSQIVGFNRAGELYDPLVNGATVAEFFGNASFVSGKGLRLQETNGYARYRLVQPISSGEFSLDVEGISNAPFSSSGNTGKLKILSMDDDPGNHYTSDYLFNVQYRGFSGNPDHAISFKVLLGEDTEARKLEPDFGQRSAGVRHLQAANTYHWKATFGNFIMVTVQDGGVGGVNGSGSGRGGNTIYEFGKNGSNGYQPAPHFAYIGVNNSRDDTGSWPATYRNVWLANKARPDTLGSAMAPR
jgi:hypothetical protein